MGKGAPQQLTFSNFVLALTLNWTWSPSWLFTVMLSCSGLFSSAMLPAHVWFQLCRDRFGIPGVLTEHCKRRFKLSSVRIGILERRMDLTACDTLCVNKIESSAQIRCRPLKRRKAGSSFLGPYLAEEEPVTKETEIQGIP